MITSASPIGVFDSGLGGLTVARAIMRSMPRERIIYFGDTAHLPYGDKSPTAIRRYSTGITNFLLTKGCKAIVIACNTASALAYTEVKKLLPPQIPVINVIDPVVRYAGMHFADRKVGIIGTKGTIQSGIYEKKLNKLNKGIQAVSLATPLLVPMIEEDFLPQALREEIIAAYLSSKKLSRLQGIILGCTHYPMITKQVGRYYKGKTEVIDSASVTGEAVAQQLAAKGLLNTQKAEPKHIFYVSDHTDTFERIANRFLGEKIKLKKSDLWRE